MYLRRFNPIEQKKVLGVNDNNAQWARIDIFAHSLWYTPNRSVSDLKGFKIISDH